MRPTILVAAVATLAITTTAQRLPWAGHWKLDEKSGNTAKDSAFHANDGTLLNFTGTPWVTGKLGGALSFDGVDDYVRINIKKGLPIYDGRGSPYAVTFWVRGGPQEDKRVYSEGNGKGNNRPLFTIGTGRVSRQTGDKLHVFTRNDANRAVVNTSSQGSVFDNTWHHVAWVDVAGLGTLYIDGVKDAQSYDYTLTPRGTRTPDFGTYSLDVASIGAVLRQTACCLFKGDIDDLRVFATSLTAADVKTIMNGGPGPSCRPSIGLFGYGCPAATPLAFAAGGSAALGASMTLQIQKGVAKHAAVLLAGAQLAPTDLGSFGLTGCQLYTPLQGLLTIGIGTIDAQGNSIKLSVGVPNNSSLVCGMVSFQGATLGGSPLRIALSNGASVLIGQ